MVSLLDDRRDGPRPEVLHQHVTGELRSLERAVDVLNGHDVVSLQHEYGIYGGSDGVEILDLLTRLEVPTIVTLHTVLDEPTRDPEGDPRNDRRPRRSDGGHERDRPA